MAPAVIATIGHRFPDAAIERAAAAPYGVEVRNLGSLPRGEALLAARDAMGVLLGVAFRLDAEHLAELPACRVIVRYGVGLDNIDVAAAAQRQIEVLNVPDYGIEEVANHTLALLLGLARRLDVMLARARGSWSEALRGLEVRRLSSCTLGVVGLGRIGRAVVERATPLWGRIVYFDPFADGAAALGPKVERLHDLEELMARADFLTLHVPSGSATRGLISRSLLERLPRGAVLVNCSRGDVLDEAALIVLLRAGHIAAAGLDVFENEPTPNPALLELGNVWPTPHAAWFSERAVIDLRSGAAARAARHIAAGQGVSPPR